MPRHHTGYDAGVSSLTHRRTTSDKTPGLSHRGLVARLLLGGAVAAVGAVVFLAMVLLVLGNWEPLKRLDKSVADSLHSVAVQHPGLVRFLDIVASVGQPNVFRALLVVAAIWLWVKGARRLALWVVVTTAVGAMLAVGLKILVARARPNLPSPVAHAGGYSMPSGHALGSMLGVGILLLVVVPLLSRGGRIVAYVVGAAVVLLIGYDRVALGVHYVSDVVAGWVVAVAVIASTAVAFEVWRRDQGEAPSSLREGVDPEAARHIT